MNWEEGELPIVLSARNKNRVDLKMWKNLLDKVRGRLTSLKREKEVTKKARTEEVQQRTEEINKSTESGEKKYSNRFLKFYYQNQKQLNQQRRKSYSLKKREGICVRCRQKALSGIVFCGYHQQKQQRYNSRSRDKSV